MPRRLMVSCRWIIAMTRLLRRRSSAAITRRRLISIIRWRTAGWIAITTNRIQNHSLMALFEPPAPALAPQRRRVDPEARRRLLQRCRALQHLAHVAALELLERQLLRLLAGCRRRRRQQ